MKTMSAVLAVLFAAALAAMESGTMPSSSGCNGSCFPQNPFWENPMTVSSSGGAVPTLRNLHARMHFLMDQLSRRLRKDPADHPFGIPKFSSGPVTLPGIPSHIQLDPIWIMGNGTIGWANSNPGFGDNISYGRIYVYGIQIPQGVPWIGNVFPTSKTISSWGWELPCFAVTPGSAEVISAQPW